MLPVSSSEPAMTTRIRPTEKTAPVKNVVRPPQVSGSSPAETTIASSPPNAMYAPARNPATTIFDGGSFAFLTPVSTPAFVIACGSLYGMARRYPAHVLIHTNAVSAEHG